MVKAKKKSAKKVVVKKAVKKKVLPIPKGYNAITAYLIVNGAANAIAFYKKVFDAREVMVMSGDHGKVGHAELKIGDSKIMLADECPKNNARAPESFGGSPISIHLYVKNVDAVVESAVAAGAKLLRPVQNMFYGDRSGGVQDPFGHVWYVATHVEDVSAAEMKKRMASMCSKDSHDCSSHG